MPTLSAHAPIAGIAPTAAPVPRAATIAAAGERVLLAAAAAVLAVLVPGAAANLMERPVVWSRLLAPPAARTDDGA